MKTKPTLEPNEDASYTVADLLAEVDREIELRKVAYTKWTKNYELAKGLEEPELKQLNKSRYSYPRLPLPQAQDQLNKMWAVRELLARMPANLNVDSLPF